MIYLYAYTNHKENLDSLRRVLALYDELKNDFDCELLVNEFRAQLLAKEWGYPLATTIETIKDIDAVASVEDTIIIDSPEKLEGKVLEYPQNFKEVIYLDTTNQSLDGAKNFRVFEDGYIYPILEQAKKEEKTIFIYGDSDYEKTILKNLDFFKNKEIDLYWGIYFFVKYEDALAEVFRDIIEPEEYYEVLKNYQKIITSSVQIAIESLANKAEVAFLPLNPTEDRSPLEQLSIPIIKNNSSIFFNKIDNNNLINLSIIIKNYLSNNVK